MRNNNISLTLIPLSPYPLIPLSPYPLSPYPLIPLSPYPLILKGKVEIVSLTTATYADVLLQQPPYTYILILQILSISMRKGSRRDYSCCGSSRKS